VACGWFGINTWIGGGILHDLTCLWAPATFARWDGGPMLFFFIFGAVNVAVVWWGMEGIRRVLVVKGCVCVCVRERERGRDECVRETNSNSPTD
jgi:cytosine/uracil/thiamine/allantoin permease